MSATSVTITDVVQDLAGNPVGNAVVTARPVQEAKNAGTDLVSGEAYASTGVTAQQTLTMTGSPTGGSILVGGAAIQWNSTAAQTQTALQASLGVAVTVTGTQMPAGSQVITWPAPGAHAALVVGVNSLTGGTTPTAVIAGTTRVGSAVGSFTLAISATDDVGTANVTGTGAVLYKFEVVHPTTREKYMDWVGPVPHASTTPTLAALAALAVEESA